MNLGIYRGISIFFLMRYWNSEFRNRNSNFLTLQTSEFKKYFPTGIFGIKNGIVIPLTMGVPEIGTQNWNSQPSLPLTQALYHHVYSSPFCNFSPCRSPTEVEIGLRNHNSACDTGYHHHWCRPLCLWLLATITIYVDSPIAGISCAVVLALIVYLTLCLAPC